MLQFIRFSECFPWIFSDFLDTVVLDTHKKQKNLGGGLIFFHSTLDSVILSFFQNVLIHNCVCIWRAYYVTSKMYCNFSQLHVSGPKEAKTLIVVIVLKLCAYF